MTTEGILELAHREAWRYKKSSDPAHSDTYTFNRATLLEFARKITTRPKGAGMNINERIGAEINRAAAELPLGYDLTIDVERDAGSVALWIPPVSDEEPGRRVDDFLGDDIAYQIEHAIKMAVEHAEEVGA